MSVLCVNVRRLCVPNIMSLGISFKKFHLVEVGTFAWYSVKIRVIFSVRFERRKIDKKSKPTWKLKHANFILEPFEYLCRMSSKLSYTVSKLMGLSETQCLLNAERFFQSAATGGRVEIGPRSPKS